MVYATKENNDKIDRVASLTSLSRKQVLQAMSNERKRLKGQGYKESDIKLIETTGGLSKQIQEVTRSLQVYVEQKQCPSHVVAQLQELQSVVVCNPHTLDDQTLTPFTI
jgi:molecular chaperone DnaK (HSP70)